MFGRRVTAKKPIETFQAVNLRFDAEIDVDKIAAIYKKKFGNKISEKWVHDYGITNESLGFSGYDYGWVVDHDLASNLQIKHSFVNGAWAYAPYGTSWRHYPLSFTEETNKLLKETLDSEIRNPALRSDLTMWIGIDGIVLPGIESKENGSMDITLVRHFFTDIASVGLTYLAIRKFTPAMERMLSESGFKYRCLVRKFDGKKEYRTYDELREQRSAFDAGIRPGESKLPFSMHDSNIAEMAKNIEMDFANQYCEAHELYNDFFTLTVKVQVHEKLIV